MRFVRTNGPDRDDTGRSVHSVKASPAAGLAKIDLPLVRIWSPTSFGLHFVDAEVVATTAAEAATAEAEGITVETTFVAEDVAEADKTHTSQP